MNRQEEVEVRAICREIAKEEIALALKKAKEPAEAMADPVKSKKNK